MLYEVERMSFVDALMEQIKSQGIPFYIVSFALLTLLTWVVDDFRKSFRDLKDKVNNYESNFKLIDQSIKHTNELLDERIKNINEKISDIKKELENERRRDK